MRSPAATHGTLFLVGIVLCGCASAPAHPDGLALNGQGQPVLGRADGDTASDLDAALRRAQQQRLSGDLDGATLTLSQLVLAVPDDPRVIGEYGKTLVAKGETSDALEFLSQAIARQPNDWTLYSAQGVAFDQRGDYASAQQAYKHALDLMPGEPSVLSNAGLSRMQAGDLEGAETLLQAAARSGGTNARIARNLALLEGLKARKAADAANAPAAAALPASASATARPAAPASPAPAASIETAAIGPAAPATSVQTLARDPTVVMAPIPRDDEPKPAKPAAVAAKPAMADAPSLQRSPETVAAGDGPPVKLRAAQ